MATFEVSDTTGFTNAYPVQATELNGFVTGTTYTFVANTNQAFLVNVAAAAAFRVRLSTTISGTGTVNVGIQANGMATEPAVTIGGTVTANQGTPNSLANGWPVEITDGTNILGTASHPVRIDPTGTTTQPVSGTVTANQGTSPWVDNITQWASTTLGAPSNYGTSPGAVEVIGVNAFVTNIVAENLTQVGGSSITLGQKTSANSVPVVIASDQSPVNVAFGGQTPVLTYFTDSAVASGSTTTHSLAGPVVLDRIDATASGEMKLTVAIGITGSEVTYWQGFNSASNQDISFILPYGYTIPSGSSAKVTLKNRDTAAQDLYVTFFNH